MERQGERNARPPWLTSSSHHLGRSWTTLIYFPTQVWITNTKRKFRRYKWAIYRKVGNKHSKKDSTWLVLEETQMKTMTRSIFNYRHWHIFLTMRSVVDDGLNYERGIMKTGSNLHRGYIWNVYKMVRFCPPSTWKPQIFCSKDIILKCED